MTERCDAELSLCGQFRYSLTRVWDDKLPTLTWIMLNPSTADAQQDDATIRRVRGFTKREACGGFTVVNVYAYRATDPADLHAYLRANASRNPENLKRLERHIVGKDVIAAWGGQVRVDIALREAKRVLARAKSLRCFGLTKGKKASMGQRTGQQPVHPLMLKRDAPLIPYEL